MKVTLRNPRITASVDIELEDGTKITTTVARDASQEVIVGAIQTEVRAESAKRVAEGAAPIVVPTEADLVPALAALRQLQDQPFEVE